MSSITNTYTLSIPQQRLTSPLKTNVTLSHIFSYLEGRELGRSSVVCRQWKKLIDQPELWQALLFNCFNFSGPLDLDLLKPAFKHNFLFYVINVLQSHRQLYIQFGDWRASGIKAIPSSTEFSKIIIENPKKHIFMIFNTNMALTDLRIERNYIFAIKCPDKIYFWNYKNFASSFREVTSFYKLPGPKRFKVENGFILLTHEYQAESFCELIPWAMQSPKHFIIGAKPTFFTNAECLQVDKGWLYAFNGSKYLAWNLQKSHRQSVLPFEYQNEEDAVTFKSIPFGHNGKFDFHFLGHGINYKNLLFRIWDDGPHYHVIVRDLNLNSQVVKTFANCQTKDGTFNTTLFESLLRLCITPQKVAHITSERHVSKK